MLILYTLRKDSAITIFSLFWNPFHLLFLALTAPPHRCWIAGMSKFLFCVEKPSNEHNEKEWRFWREVSNRIEARIKTIEGVQKPCENVWRSPHQKVWVL